MNPNDMFDYSKNMDAFTKFYPDFGANSPMKAMTDMAAKYRAVAIEALNRNVELTTAWMNDAAKDATTLMTVEAPEAYAKKAGEVATAAFQDLPSRLFAYAEVAKKAQAEILDTVIAATPKAVDDAANMTKSVVKTATRKAA
ncbi:MAG: hypothetical protein SGJ21_16725 [Alphaproteobacteria bacterium]|nr:hypothetical protein [Alphaproteobacteria bacterium]